MRNHDEIPGLRDVHRGELFAHALGESRASAGEDRHVGAQAQAQGGDAVLVPAELPEMVQGQERRGGVGAAAADAAPHGQALVQPDVDALRAAGGFLQPARGAHDQVAVVRHPGDFRVQAYLAVLAGFEMQLVAVVEELEQCLQLVIAIVAAAEDMQEQIELGRGWQAEAHAHVSGRAGAAASP